MSRSARHQKSMTRSERQAELKKQGQGKKSRRQKIALIATGLLVVLAVVAAATTGLLNTGRDSSSARRQSPTTNNTTIGTEVSDSKCRTPLTPADPLRLWIGGDSLAGSLGPALGQQMADTGIVQPTYDSRISSGLGNSGFFDWPKQATAEMERLNPEVVVFIIGTNDYSLARSAPTDATGVPTWKAKYVEQVEAMLRIFETAGTPTGPRKIYWVSGPTIKETRIDTGVKEINAVAKEVAARHPQVTFIDGYALFSSPAGSYSTAIDIENGKSTRVRTDDGVHFTPSGGDFLGRAVATQIDQNCRIASQAVVGQPKSVLRTSGSTQIPGTYREPEAPAPTTTAPTTTTVPTTTAPTTTTTEPIAPAPAAPTTTAPTTTTAEPVTPAPAAPATPNPAESTASSGVLRKSIIRIST